MTGTRHRVAFVSSHAQLGGSERYLETLVTNLGPSWDPVMIYLQDGPAVTRASARGIDAHVLEVGSSPAALIKGSRHLKRTITELRADLVHANGIKAAVMMAASRSRVAFVWAKHDFSWTGPLTRSVARRARLVIGVSAAVLEGIPSAKARVIPPGLPPITGDRARGVAELRSLTGSDGPFVSLVGLLNPVKGHRDLIAAAPAIQEAVPAARIVFVGGTDAAVPREREALELAATSARAPIAFAGHRDDGLDLIAGSDVVVVPTIATRRGGREGFGMVAVEALSLGTPVVGYGHGATTEIVGECGELVPPGDKDALAQAVVTMLTDGDRRKRAIRCGQERVGGRYTIADFVTAMENAYAEALTPA